MALASRLVTELCLLLVVAAASGVDFAHVVSRTVTMEPHGACCPPATDTSALLLVLWWWRDGLLGCCFDTRSDWRFRIIIDLKERRCM